MNSYFIFAIVLTVAYIIYYAVIIALTSTGKRGRTNRTRKFSTSAHRKRKRVWLSRKARPASVSVARTTRRKVRLPLPKHPLRMSRTNRERRRRNWNG